MSEFVKVVIVLTTAFITINIIPLLLFEIVRKICPYLAEPSDQSNIDSISSRQYNSMTIHSHRMHGDYYQYYHDQFYDYGILSDDEIIDYYYRYPYLY